jgi:tRNA nucleotidyltransferase (CCA-adding enzyme)
MNLILCHTTADFDALGAAVGLCVLHPGSRIVLTGGCHPTVKDFLALHRDEYPLIERRAVNPKQIRSMMVVDTSDRARLGKAAEWLDLPHLEAVTVYDHHPNTLLNIPATEEYIERVGATTTLIVEKLRRSQKLGGDGETANTGDSLIPVSLLTPTEATVMALGIHLDTGSLTFDHSTARDAQALAWLMAQGANLRVIAEYIDPALSPQLQDLLTVCLDSLQSETLRDYTVSWVLLNTDNFVPGLSSLAARLIDFTDTDALFLAHVYNVKESGDLDANLAVDSMRNVQQIGMKAGRMPALQELLDHTEKVLFSNRLTIIGRSRIPETNLNELFQACGGGGHAGAAATSLKNIDPFLILSQLVEQLKVQIPHPPIARELMSSPVRTIRPETLVSDAHRILLRYGHSGLSVVNDRDNLVGIITRRDIDIALHHGFSHAPVKGYMTPQLKTITPDTTLTEIESLMVTYDIGRLPVLANNKLVGIVTRTDVLRELHQQKERGRLGESADSKKALIYCPLPQSIEQLLAKSVTPQLGQFLSAAAKIAEAREWQLYLVGGAVRDLLLSDTEESLALTDLDLVVDCCQDLILEDMGESEDFSVSQDEINLVQSCSKNQPEINSNKKVIKNNCQSPAVELALALQKLYPQARLDIHGQFQTAALLWHKDQQLDSLMVDIATARTEFYPYPAANPEVEASSIRQDLYRRDFTINALAVRLSNPRAGDLLDFFGGLQDLTIRRIRVLHANSFIEDPTRIYRAVRFAVRLGFEIEGQTEGYIRHAIESGIYNQIQGKNGRTPALETRLKSELKYILQAAYWKSALQKLGNLGALRCIHGSLDLDRQLWWQLRLHERCLYRLSRYDTANFKSKFSGFNPGEDWQMRLEVLIAYLAPDYRGKVAANLQLSADSVQLLAELEEKKKEVVVGLSSCERLSQLVLLLRNYELRMLILLAVQCPRRIRRKIWEYLTKWVSFEPFLNGNDLKVLGYRPGPDFKRILDDLLVASLDGLVRDRDGAIAFLGLRYPRL